MCFASSDADVHALRAVLHAQTGRVHAVWSLPGRTVERGAAGEEHLSRGSNDGADDGLGPAVRVLLPGKQAAMTRADVAATVNGLGVGPPAVCSGCRARAPAGS